LDFTTASLDSRITFTRSGNTATVVNSSGYVTNINANLPRFDYDPVTLACKGLLIEEARTNSFKGSDLSDPAFVATTNLTRSSSSQLSPDGVNNAYSFTPTVGSAQHYMAQGSIAVISGQSYTFSVFAKPNGLTNIAITLSSSFSFASARWNMSTKTLTSSSGVTATSIQEYPDGWVRVSCTATSVSATNATMYIDTTNLGSFVGDGVNGFYAWGAQYEQGAFATSYIPTTTTALTRNADVATMTGTNFSDWYNASEGSMSVGLRLTPRTPSGTSAILYNGDSTGRWSYLVSSSARILDSTNTATAGNVIATGALNKIVSGFSALGIAIALNGAATATSSFDGTFGPATSLLIGGQSGTSSINGTFAYINYYSQRLTNAEMQSFSK
jgi:hypothetical protein